MRTKQKIRFSPYYIVVGVDEGTRMIKILDLNSIQKFSKTKDAMIYEDNENLHDTKWIPIPGSSKAEKDRTIEWMKAMMGETFMAEKNCMVYNHRSHNINPFSEEYKRKVFIEWQAAQVSEPEEKEEPEESPEAMKLLGVVLEQETEEAEEDLETE
jgi:hypothetical protein